MDNLLEQIRRSEGIFKCKECGAEEDSSKWCNGFELEQRQLCISCGFWMDFVEQVNDPNSVRVNGHHYWIGDEQDKGMRGYNGKLFVLKFKDGRIVRTTNLWNQGQIPKQFKSRLPDNATFEDIGE
jgi:hypothetical protein